MLDIEMKIQDAILGNKEIVFDVMPRREELTRAAKTANKILTFDLLPKFDQLTEYVYESSLIVSGKELQMQLMVGTVMQDAIDPNINPDIKPVEPIDPKIEPIMK